MFRLCSPDFAVEWRTGLRGQKMRVKQIDYVTLNWIMSVKIGIGEKRGSKRLYA